MQRVKDIDAMRAQMAFETAIAAVRDWQPDDTDRLLGNADSDYLMRTMRLRCLGAIQRVMHELGLDSSIVFDGDRKNTNMLRSGTSDK